MVSASQTSKKRYHHKSTTGCLTCKRRRVKCDESKPGCNRCLRTDRKCEWPPSKSSSPESDADQSQRALRALQPRSLSMFFYPTVHSINSPQDAWSFDFFRANTGPVLSCVYDHDYWDSGLLQVFQSQAPIKHIILAIGALHKNHFTQTEIERETRRYALQQYNKSIVALNEQLKADIESVDLVLFCSVLYVVMESLLNNMKGVVTHLTAAVQLLQDRMVGSSRLGLEGCVFIRRFISGLQVWHEIFYKRAAPLVMPDPVDVQPLVFTSLRDAKDYLVEIQKSQIQLEEVAKSEFRKMGAVNSPDGSSLDLASWHDILDQRLHLWEGALRLFWAQLDELHKTENENVGFRRLLILHNIIRILLRNTLGTSEVHYDASIPEFEEAMQSALSTIPAGNEVPLAASYFFLPQFAATLYFTALKCRNTTIRRQAMTIWKQVALGGFRAQWMMIEILERVLQIEEEGLVNEYIVDCTGARVPTENRRVRHVMTEIGEGDASGNLHITIRQVRDGIIKDTEFTVTG